MATAWMTFRRGSAPRLGAVAGTTAATGERGPDRAGGRRRAYQLPICRSTKRAISAAPENHAMLDCPWGTTTNAASNGPDADPMFPPTWKRDWASPYRPPAAMRATREASGWKIAEPIPIKVAENRIAGYVEARDINRRPTSVSPMPTVSEYGRGRRSV